VTATATAKSAVIMAPTVNHSTLPQLVVFLVEITVVLLRVDMGPVLVLCLAHLSARTLLSLPRLITMMFPVVARLLVQDIITAAATHPLL
jgi:hypothetical protein